MSFNQSSVKVWWTVMYGLCLKEVKRIFRIFNQTIIAPSVESIIMLVIMGMALKSEMTLSKFLESGFLLGGATGSLIIKNAFSNSASVIVISKVAGYFNDYLIPPFSKMHIFLSIIFGCIIRGFCVIISFMLVVHVFIININLLHPWLLLFLLVLISLLFGTIGVIVGFSVDGFEKMSVILSYVITPLSMFSGSFFGIEKFPQGLQKIFLFNPFFYCIDLVKYCFTGISYRQVGFEVIMLLSFTVIVLFCAYIALTISLKTDKS